MRLLFTTLLISLLAGCTSCSTPIKQQQYHYEPQPSIFAAPEAEHPTQAEYWVRTRVVIEYMTVTLGETLTMVIFATDFAIIKTELEVTEKIYAKTGIKFHISKTEFQEYGDFNDTLFADAANYPNHMSLYYRLPRLDEYFKGLSSAPYPSVYSYGILLSHERDPWTTAHEIGHFFGLLHTFSEDDMIEDTPSEIFSCNDYEKLTELLGNAKSSNCRNIMNYCEHEPKYATDGQTERIVQFIRSRRFNTIINPPPTISEDSK